MLKVIGPFRHTGTLATLHGDRFVPVRGARDSVRPVKRAPIRKSKQLDDAAMARAIRDGVAKGMARATAKLAKANRDAGIISGPVAGLSDSLDRLKGAVDTYAETRRLQAAAPRGRI